MGRKEKSNRRKFSQMFESLETRRFLSVGDLLPNGFNAGAAEVQLTGTTIAQGSKTLVISGSNIERLNSDGSVDTTFGPNGNGLVSCFEAPMSISLLPGGGIVVGEANGVDVFAQEYSADGIWNDLYGEMGMAGIALSGSDSYSGFQMMVDSSGNVTIVRQGTAAGGVQQSDPSTTYLAAARFTSSGMDDTTYAPSDRLDIDNAEDATFTELSDGSAVIVANELTTTNKDVYYFATTGAESSITSLAGTTTSINVAADQNGGEYIALNADGEHGLYHYDGATQDTSFGPHGYVNLTNWLHYTDAGVTVSSVSDVYGIGVKSDGTILVAYDASLAGLTTETAIADLNSNGSVNTDYGTDGFLLISQGNDDFTPTSGSGMTVLANDDFILNGVNSNHSPVTATFQGTDRDVNPVLSDVAFNAGNVGAKYAYVTATFDPGQGTLDSGSIIGGSLIVVSSTGIQTAATLSSVTGGDGDPLVATYAFRIDRHGLLRSDDGVYDFITQGDAVIDSFGRGSAGGLSSFSLYIAPRNQGTPVVTEVIGPSVAAANVRPQIQQMADDGDAQDQSVLDG
jgi:hypothetical protein